MREIRIEREREKKRKRERGPVYQFPILHANFRIKPGATISVTSKERKEEVKNHYRSEVRKQAKLLGVHKFQLVNI